jgi:hypothetical protein
MTLRRHTITILGAIAGGVLVLIGLTSYLEAMTLKEAAGWALAGYMSVREIVSKIENVALNIRNGSAPIEGEE